MSRLTETGQAKASLTPVLEIAVPLLVALALVTVATPLCAAPTSAVGGMDIGALMTRAEDTLDLASTDAVLLFDGRSVRVAADGTVRTTFHQIVWISTELGIEEYADLRVPWNTTNATLEVSALRTWMDERWWPHESNLNPTAIVETTPYAVASADDYTTMRETMLLHDGVELPCIMETVYTITRRFPDGTGADGLWIFRRHDPAVRVLREVLVPSDVPLSFAVGNGAPDPVVTRDNGTHRYVWVMDDQPRLGVPHVADATAYAPYVCWSTWRDWESLGAALLESIDAAAELTDALHDTVLALTEHEPYLPARIDAVAELVAGSTRHIGYDVSHWAFEPRSAGRTYETAYGHELDRAVLATALLRDIAGVNSVTPMFRTADASGLDEDVVGLARFGAMELMVRGSSVHGVYDPASSTYAEGAPDPFDGRTVWVVTDEAPRVLSVDSGPENDAASDTVTPEVVQTGVFRCSTTLERDDDGAWVGSCWIEGERALSFSHRIAGTADESERYCEGVVSDLVGDGNVLGHNVAVLDPARTVLAFAFDWDPGDQDEQERYALAFASPTSGLEARLPSGVHLYEAERTSPVLLPAPLHETLSLRVKLPEDDVVLVPEAIDVENGVGRFTQTVERDGDWLTVERGLSVEQTIIGPERWSDLRALLLIGERAQAGTILFR